MLCLAGVVRAHDDVPAEVPTGCALYVGNAGVLVRLGEAKVLFDAFYANSYSHYTLVPPNIEAAMIAGTPPFDEIDALLVSHVHGDHFSPELVLKYLRAQPRVRLFGSTQVADALRKADAQDDVMARVTAIDLAASDPAEPYSLGALSLSIAALPHAGGARMAGVQNLSFRVTLSDTLGVVHLGDAAPDVAAFERHRAHWLDTSLSAAFPPHWLLEGDAGRAIVKEYLPAQHVIGVHVPTAADDSVSHDRFTDPGEVRGLGASKHDACAVAARP